MQRSARTFTVGNIFTGNRIAAIILWLVGVWTTGQALAQMGMPEPTFISAAALQAILTIGQRPVWRNGKWAFVGVCFIGVDVFFNFGGVWPFAQNIDKTQAWKSVVTAFYGTQITAPTLSRAAFGLIISLAIAAGVEWLWYEAD